MIILKERPRLRLPPGAVSRRPAAAALALAFLLGALAGGRLWEAGRSLASRARAAVLRSWARARAEAPRLTLDIAHKDYLRLEWTRRNALARGVLLAGSEDFVDARVSAQGRTERAQVRLKGDWTDHLEGRKWSFRVKLKGEGRLLGLREFSLQRPGTRNGLAEWAFHRALRREGLLSPRYELAFVTVNGVDHGAYALEAHFDKRLPEEQRRREGPILKLGEELLWAERASVFPHWERSPAGIDHARVSPVEGFQAGLLRAEPLAREQFLEGARLLEEFRAGRLPAERVFDARKTGLFLALCELFGARHATVWHNLRFYYDPLAARLEPVGFDGDAGEAIAAPRVGAEGDPVLGRLLADPAVAAEYLAALRRVSEPAYLERFLAELEPAARAAERVLRAEDPDAAFEPEPFRRNARVLRAALDPPRAVNAYFRSGSGALALVDAANLVPLPVEIAGAETAGGVKLLAEGDARLAPWAPDAAAAYRTLRLRLPSGRAWEPGFAEGLKLVHRVGGVGEFRFAAVFPQGRAEAPVAEAAPRAEANDRSFAFLTRDERARVVRARPGRWRLARTLVLPDGYAFAAGPGTRLELGPGASILARGRLELAGAEGAPVVIAAAEGGGGVFVLRAEGLSRLERVRFEGLSAPRGPGWSPSGAITFYESPAELSGVEIAGSRAEDALNLVGARFGLTRVLIADSSGDALDADFAEVSVADSAFVGSGNDALDFSGSAARVERVRVERAGDKAVSAGELSRVAVRALTVAGAGCGAAAKDLSELRIVESEIAGARVGLAAYQKKPEFGPATIEAAGVRVAAEKAAALVEPRSRIASDGSEQAAAGPELAALLAELRRGS